MFKSKRNKILLGVIATSLLLSACGKGDLQEQIDQLTETNQRLVEERQTMMITENTIESSLRTVEGSNIPEFHTIEGKVNFPNPLYVENSNHDVSNSNVMVGSRFRFVPSNNWMTKINGSVIEFSHPSKVWGNIRAIRVKDHMNDERAQDTIQAFFKDFPATNISYRKMFVDDRSVGLLAKAEITVDRLPHVVNVGVMSRGEYGLIFMFMYEDNMTGVQQELIDLLVTSGRIGDALIKLE